MLNKLSWLQLAKGLPANSRARVDHACGPGRTLLVSSNAQGYRAHCFRCNDHGWEAPDPEPLAVRLARLNKQREQDDRIGAAVALPKPQVRDWAKWPEACRLWLLKAGLCSADLPGLVAYYHPPSDRVVVPVLGPSGGVLFWQARAVDGRQPKYIAPPIDKTAVVPRYGSAATVTLTEDLLSAYKVGKVGEGWCLLGTSLSNHTLAQLVSRGCEVNVWLDPDGPGQRAATKVLAKLRAAGVRCRNIVSTKDPKLVHLSDMKGILYEDL